MLNPFPSLLIYSFFAPTLLRIAAGAIILLLANAHREKHREIAELLIPLMGRLGKQFIWAVVLVETLVGAALIAGFMTQYAAIVGAVLAIRSLIIRPRNISPFDRSTDWLLLVICISLLFTGAGALAFDVPL